MATGEDSKSIICDHCERQEAIPNTDEVPRGWMLLFAFDDDDGNDYPARDACTVDCLVELAEQAQRDLTSREPKAELKEANNAT